MDFNPFVNWIEQEAKNRDEMFVVPDDSLLPMIYKTFGIRDLSILESDDPDMEVIRRAFVELWRASSFEEHGIVANGKTIDGCPVTNSDKIDKITIRYIDGFISKDHLNTFFKRAIKGDGENSRNPFNKFAAMGDSKIIILPDMKYLPKLYKELGVKNFEEIRLSKTDYDSAFKGYKYPEYNDILQVIYEDIPPMGVVWSTLSDLGENMYVNRLHPQVVKNLALRIANLRKAGQGKMPLAEVPRDVFASIVRQDLKGKDLISLCRSNDKINAYCNQNDQQLFKQRLLSEFGEEWYVGSHGYDFPRDLYVQMHKTYFDIFQNQYGDGYHIDTMENGLVDEQKPVVRVVPYPEWSTDGETKHLLIFFPDHPEISCLYVDEPENGGDVFRHAEGVRGFIDDFELLRIAEEASRHIADDGIYVFGHHNDQFIEGYIMRADLPEGRNFADDIVYVFSLDRNE
jgi:hypothetical protein